MYAVCVCVCVCVKFDTDFAARVVNDCSVYKENCVDRKVSECVCFVCVCVCGVCL